MYVLYYRPGQEEGNIPFVENAGFGLYNTNPNEIARIVCSWLESPTKLELLQQNAINASRPNATLDIAKDIIELVYTKKKQYTNNQLNQKQQQNLPSPLYFLS